MERKNLIGSALTIWGRSGLSSQTASHRGIRLAPLLLVAVMLAAMAVLAETSNPAQTAHAHGRDDHTHIYTSPPAEYCPTYRDAPEERTYLETTMTVGAATRQSRSVTIDLPDCGETSTAITGISASKLGTAPDLTGLVADCNTLLDLKDDLTGTRSGSLNWSADTAMDSWDGITVAKTPPRVTRLELARKGLTGTIPEELANLTNLEKLALWENQLTGPIPAALGHLTMLNTLWLSNNRLSGAIPSQWGAPTGPSPLTALRELRLASNRLSGAIPPTLGSLQELRYLSLGENQLSGSIPKELGNLTNLAELVLDSNQLSGAIPSELGNLTRLTSLGLQYNQLTGLVPPELGNLTRMWSLTFHSNQLTGPIPPELGNLTMAIFLYMDNNRLSGEIPEELGNLTGIHEITLNGNPLTGPIPAELSDPAELTRLWLHDTRWTGTIPAELVARTEQNTLTMDLRTNRRPVAPAVGDKDATTGEEFTYQVVFTDPDGHDLTYSAMQADDTPLPSWLKFDPATGNLSGTPPTDESISVRITAKDSPTDSSPPLSASVILTIESGPEKVTPPPTPAGGAPTISGTPRVGETLTADTTAINDEDGLTNVSYEYQWIAGGTDIDGATGSTFELTASEVGKTIRVRVTFTDDADNEESLTSVATVAVAAAATNPLTGFTVVDAVTNPQTVLGTLTDGVTLTLDDPDNGSYGIRVDIASGVQVGSVQLQLTGGKSVDHTEGIAPYSLYGDGGAGALNGESLPEGNYTLTANAYSERSLGGDLLGTLTVSFTVKGATAEVSNTAATGTPDITGMPQVDETLTADTSAIDDEDGLTNVAFEYQWIADGTDIAGATGSTYTLASSELGKTIQVKVTFTDDAGNEETLTSEATVAVTTVANREATGLPTITGTPQVGETLTAHTSAIDDPDGLENAVFGYQWFASKSGVILALLGETSSTYTLAPTDEGYTLQVRVSFTDDADNQESLTSEATVAVAAAAAQAPLTAAFQDLPDSHDGSTAFTFRVLFSEDVGISYANMRDDAFSLSEGDVTKARRVDGRNDLWEITVEPDDNSDVSITLPANRSCATTGAICTREDSPRQLTNGPTATVTGPAEAPPTNTSAAGAPTISGAPQVEQTLTADTSSITDEDGLTNVSYRYQWIAGGSDIDGATSSTYTLTASEQGGTIQVRVTFTDDAGDEETLTSAATEAVAAKPAPLTVSLPDSRFQSARHKGADDRPQVIVAFSMAVASFEKTTPSLSLTGATLRSVRQHQEDGLENAWIFFLDPDGSDDIVFSLVTGQSCDSGGICTDDGRRLSSAVQTTLPGPDEDSEPENPTPDDPNSPATGAPTVSGTPQVDQTLTASTSNIADADGLSNVSYGYQWLAAGTAISGATGSTYTLTANEQGDTIQVRVSFNDDKGNAESLTSVATDAVAAKPAPLTASFSNMPDSHDGSAEFTFDLTFSENFPLSYVTLRDHAFTKDAQNEDHVVAAKRKVPGSNQTWTITVEPSGTGAITITLPETTDCDDDGAICTDDGRMLSHAVTVTVPGPSQ